MPAPSLSSFYWQGLRAGAPFFLVIGPFGLLFGVLAAEAGLNLFETLSFSVVVIAGAAQFTALQLLQDQAPTLVVLASALAVNLRMAMYSASITPEYGLDFALPIAFLAMIAPALRSGAHVVAALVATLGALLLAFIPYNLGVLLAALCGMMAGAETERRMGA